jgi:hypothetical protein
MRKHHPLTDRPKRREASSRKATADEVRTTTERQEMNTEQKKKTFFECSCNGCRNYPTHPAEIWHQSQIPSKEKGTYYFTPEAMRFFNSKIVDFKPVGVSRPDVASLFVIVSSKYDSDATRHYEIVSLCPYGTINRNSEKYETLREARKNWNMTKRPAPVCDCHGCQLDREGRN